MSELVTRTEADTYTMISMDDGKANALSFEMFEAITAHFQPPTLEEGFELVRHESQA